jgi:hypothetical protein
LTCPHPPLILYGTMMSTMSILSAMIHMIPLHLPLQSNPSLQLLPLLVHPIVSNSYVASPRCRSTHLSHPIYLPRLSPGSDATCEGGEHYRFYREMCEKNNVPAVAKSPEMKETDNMSMQSDLSSYVVQSTSAPPFQREGLLSYICEWIVLDNQVRTWSIFHILDTYV